MDCTNPLSGFRDAEGRIRLSQAGGFEKNDATFRCGWCMGCRLTHAREWAARLHNEATLHETSSFLTLTYSDEKLPKDLSLDVTHWQKFAKRVRKKKGKFRFYHCGEYAPQTLRPHYHAILYGLSFEDQVKGPKNNGNQLYTSEELDKLWGHGHCWIGEVTRQSVEYVARYSVKKVRGTPAEAHYNGRKPEYATMSRRPGIGQGYIEKWLSQIYPRDEVIIEGKRMKPPLFYDRYLEQVDPELYEEVKERRIEELKENLKPEEQTKKRRAAKETYRQSIRKTFERKGEFK